MLKKNGFAPLSRITGPDRAMRHLQDDLLIAYALLEFAHSLEENCDIEDPMEEHARDLAGKIVNQHGLYVMEVPRQLELRKETYCW